MNPKVRGLQLGGGGLMLAFALAYLAYGSPLVAVPFALAATIHLAVGLRPPAGSRTGG